MPPAQICSLPPGTLQYVPETLAELVAKLGDAQPPQVLVNRTALWDGETFFTLQSLGPVIWLYSVQNREAIVTGMEQEGYRVKGTWKCPESKINVRWHIHRRVRAHAGFFAGTRLKQFSYPATDRIPSG